MLKIAPTAVPDISKVPQGTLSSFCSMPFVHFKVTCDGFVTMCCFQTRKCLGNILQQSFDEIWFGPLAEEIRRETLANNLHPLCSVAACPFFHREKQASKVLYRGYPSEFEIDLPSQHCNIGGEVPTAQNPACLMCERNRAALWQDDKLNEVCEKLKPYVKHIRQIHIQGVAEPFWKDRIFEIIDLLELEKFKTRVTITTTTNGTLMTEERRKRFLQYPKSILTWSFDASTPETFVKIRRVNMYDKIVENLLNYSRERRPGQEIHIHNNINLLNVGEVVGMVELAAKAKVDLLDFNPTCNVPVICVDEINYKIFRKAQLDIVAAAKQYGVKTTFMRNLTLDYDKQAPLLLDPNQDARLVKLSIKSKA